MASVFENAQAVVQVLTEVYLDELLDTSQIRTHDTRKTDVRMDVDTDLTNPRQLGYSKAA